MILYLNSTHSNNSIFFMFPALCIFPGVEMHSLEKNTFIQYLYNSNMFLHMQLKF